MVLLVRLVQVVLLVQAELVEVRVHLEHQVQAAPLELLAQVVHQELLVHLGKVVEQNIISQQQ